MILSREEEAMLNGEFGEGSEIAMSVLTKLGEMYGANKMLRVVNVHIDGSAYGWINDSGLDFIERLSTIGTRFRVPATLNPSSIDFKSWKELDMSPRVAQKQLKIANALKKMGATPTWTCAPYQYGAKLRFGQNVAWGESNAVGFANSIVGARTERLGDLADVCSAIVGRYPNFGLYLDENRRGQVLFDLETVNAKAFDPTDYGIVGFYIGSIAESRVPVVKGLPRNAGVDHLKSFCAAAAVGGSVGLSHLCGISPEEGTLSASFGDSKPQEKVTIELGQLRQTKQKLNTFTGKRPEVVCLGCPHYSVHELRKIAQLVNGKKVRNDTSLFVLTSRAAKTLASGMGTTDIIESSGAKVIADTCWCFIPCEKNALMTDSVKMAWTSLGKFSSVALDSSENCVKAAVE